MNQSPQDQQSPEVPPTAPEQPPLWKQLLDVTCIVLALPFLLPTLVLIGVLIKLVSTGPILFKQERVGYRGRRFQCYKFRSMKVTSDQSVHQKHMEKLIGANLPMTKMDAKGDQRLIPLGWLLRATGLDELPQLLNVLRGEMSLVGPRPCLPFEYERYLPWQRERFNTLPGLTGLWQVSGKNHTTFIEMVRLDIAYSRNKSFWLDIKILLKTLPAVIGQTQEISAVVQPQAKTAGTSSLSKASNFRLGKVAAPVSINTDSRI